MSDLDQLVSFTDKWIGANYYSKENLRNLLLQGIKGNINASLVAVDGDKIVGARITLAPGEWIQDYSGKITPAKWDLSKNKVAYFKSLFIDEEYQGQGLGKKLSGKSIENLQMMGAKGIICHSWLESPNNSSQRYLEKMGFIPIENHPKFWHEIDYLCTRCAPKRCVCTACEMLLLI